MNTTLNLVKGLLRSSAFRGAALLATALVSFGIATVQSQATLPPEITIAADPLYSRGVRSKPTLTLALSVEFPTVGGQYLDANYASTTEYIGYFDTDSCYTYNNHATALERRFDRSGPATARQCGGTAFSGNFMNWATSSAIDVLRLGLTGGDRIVDTDTLTVLQRAVIQENFYNSSNFPSKRLPAAIATQSVPTALLNGHTGDVFIANCLNRVYFGTESTGNCNNPGNNGNLGGSTGGAAYGPITNYSGALPAGYTDCAAENGTCSFTGIRRVYYGAGVSWKVVSANNGIACTNGVFGDPLVGTAKRCYQGADPSGWTPGGSTGMSSDLFFYARVSVCGQTGATLTDPRTSYCLRYSSGNYKPIGNLQRYSESIRVAAFGYLNDSTGNPNQRYGGVLRAPMKYVGPKAYDSNYNLLAGTNGAREWDPTTGVFLRNPDNASGVTAGTGSNWSGQTISGVVNYLNQFGRTGATQGQYKTYDPVGELYYEALRYVQGLQPTPDATSGMTDPMKDGFPVYTTWDDPHPAVVGMTDYKCVKNNIVLIGDVNTHNDKYFPGSTRTGNEPATARAYSTASNEPNFMEWTKVVGKFEAGANFNYVDGNGATQSTSGNSSPVPPGPTNTARDGMENQAIGADNASYFMAGAAYWANTHDIRGTGWTAEPSKQRPGMRLTTYILDVNEYGSQNDPGTRRNNQFFLAAKYGGFTDSTGTGHPWKKMENGNVVNDTSNTSWMRAGSGGEAKNYFLSSSARAVLDALDEIFAEIARGANSIAGSAVSTQSVSTGAGGTVYQAQFDPMNYWSGDVTAYALTAVGTDGLALTPNAVTAGSRLDGLADVATRKIFIGTNAVNPATTAMTFKWADVDTATKNAMKLPPGAVAPPYDSDAVGEARLNYLRGVRTGEGSTFRMRGSRLGDIVNSGIAYSGAPPTTITGSAYQTFATANASRPTTLFVGANDGMLHAFNAATMDELFAYIPSWLTPKLTLLTASGYVHRSYVDATPVVAEADVGGTWKTVLVGGTGGGGQGVYALDVSNPSTFDASKVMWEFTDKHDASLGNVVGQPQILKFRTTASTASTPQYKTFAVVASGVNNYAADGSASTTGRPALFFLDLAKPAGTAWSLGTNYFKIEFPRATVDRAQGMIGFSAVAGLVSDEVNYIYAGDLQGNLWKLDFTKEGAATWSINTLSFYKNGTTPVPMFVSSVGSTVQPITMPPAIAYGPNRTFLVAFGTGKFLESSDVAGPYGTQSIYILYDDNNPLTALDTTTAAIGGRGRLQASTVSGNVVTAPGAIYWGRPISDTDLTMRAGWYIDFPGSTSGERQVSSFSVLGSRIIAGSVIPAGSSCTDGSGNIYSLDLFTGTGTTAVSDVGVLSSPIPIEVANSAYTTDTDTTGARRHSVKYSNLITGAGGQTTGSNYTIDTQVGRLSWRQLNNPR